MQTSHWVEILAGVEFAPVRNFFYTVCGATALYLFSLSKGFRGSTPVLRKLMPDHSTVFYDRIDFFAGGCRRSRGCSIAESADGRFVVEATMGSLVVVEVGPRLELSVSLL